MNEALFSMLQGSMKAQHRDESARAGQWNLGMLLTFLKSLPADMSVKFADGTYPGSLMSYRGYYCDIAVERSTVAKNVSDFRAEVNAAIGKEFTGYKGGEFRMDVSTPVWVAPYGRSTRDGIVGTKVEGDTLILEVAKTQVDDE